MKTEDLLTYLENDENFEEVHPFKEFLSGCDDETVYVLYVALGSILQTIVSTNFNICHTLYLIAEEEYRSR